MNIHLTIEPERLSSKDTLCFRPVPLKTIFYIQVSVKFISVN
jgi:hypothetical protein